MEMFPSLQQNKHLLWDGRDSHKLFHMLLIWETSYYGTQIKVEIFVPYGEQWHKSSVYQEDTVTQLNAVTVQGLFGIFFNILNLKYMMKRLTIWHSTYFLKF